MNYPLLYEINTRCLLHALSQREGRVVTLGDVPDAELDRWHALGFTHIWAMGVWTTHARARALAMEDSGLRAAYDQLIPGWKPEDVPGSPYAVGDYTVAHALGGEAGLKKFRAKLRKRGMKLFLDFVPNHVGVGHRWLTERPEIFVQSPAPAPGTFEQKTRVGVRQIAHGKDPYFPPWTDTAQVNFRRPEARAAMTELLQHIAARCDGVRCDMAMLPLNEVFARTWSHLPESTPAPHDEFWPDAINAVKREHPGFVFLAEAYWGLEPKLQSLGFDFTYGKMLHDHLRDRNFAGLQRGLLDTPRDVLAASAHFLENHDESRAAEVLPEPQYRAAALLLLAMPGMRFLYEGQLEGRRLKTPVQLNRWPDEPLNAEVLRTYEQVLTVVKQSAIGRGEWRLLQPIGWPDNQSARNIIAIQWQRAGAPASGPAEFDLAVMNLAPSPSQCIVQLTVPYLESHNWEMRDVLGSEHYEKQGAELEANGLYLGLQGNAAQLFHFQADKSR